MRKTKKLTALVLTSVMAVSVLAGCGSNKTPETAAGADGEKKTLKVAMPLTTGRSLQTIMARFQFQEVPIMRMVMT